MELNFILWIYFSLMNLILQGRLFYLQGDKIIQFGLWMGLDLSLARLLSVICHKTMIPDFLWPIQFGKLKCLLKLKYSFG